MFELPPQGGGVPYASAWKHALAKDELGGPFGLRTVEPSYIAKYMVQYRYDAANGAAGVPVEWAFVAVPKLAGADRDGKFAGGLSGWFRSE